MRRGGSFGPRAAAALAGLLLLAVPGVARSAPAAAGLADTQLADPAAEGQARALMETLRCLVCQGQSIADSDAALAGDMRALVRERIGRGDSVDSVRRWLIARYGDYVSYDPPLSRLTAPLWSAPLVLLAVGWWIVRGSFRRRR